MVTSNPTRPLLPNLVTPLPGPKAAEIIERIALFFLPRIRAATRWSCSAAKARWLKMSTKIGSSILRPELPSWPRGMLIHVW